MPAAIKTDGSELSISIVPGLLGFSLGAFAIVLAFPTSKMFDIISERGRTDSYYMDLSSKLVHFILVQILALLIAIIAKTYPALLTNMLSFLFLIYSLLTALITAFSLFGVAQIYNRIGGHRLK